MRKGWTKDHTKGVLIGVITPLLFIPIVIFVLSWIQNYDFSRLWREFAVITKYRIKIITLSIISKLFWFYFFLNRERYNVARGVIIGTLFFAPYILYIKVF